MEALVIKKVSRVIETNDIGEIRDLLKSSSNLSYDIKHFIEKLQSALKDDINTHYFDDRIDPGERYTLMQFATKSKLVDLIKALLEFNIDPNFVERKKSISKKKSHAGLTEKKSYAGLSGQILTENGEVENCQTPPILLAAENGYHEVLKVFKYHNFYTRVGPNQFSRMNSTPFSREEASVLLKDENRTDNYVDFSVSQGITMENVLHIVLQQRLLEKPIVTWSKKDIRHRRVTLAVLNKQNSTVSHHSYPHRSHGQSRHRLFSLKGSSLKKEILDIADDYLKCANVLLDMDEFEKRNAMDHPFPKHIRNIVNQKDIEGNIPLHYAASNWSEEIVKRLLSLGSNPSVKNKNKEIPLWRIQRSTLEDFMNKKCIIVEDFDPSDDEIDENTDDSDDENESANKLLEDYDQTFMMKISQCGKNIDNKMTFDYAFLAPPKFQRSQFLSLERVRKTSGNMLDEENTKTERDHDDSIYYLSEMELLSDMSECPEIRPLLKHPVIDSFLWLKWKLMTKFFNRNLRIDILFTYCMTWHIFVQYGGRRWNSVGLALNDTYQVGDSSKFCEEPTYHFELVNIDEYINFTMVWYLLFVGHTVIQLVYILKDLRRDLSMKFSANYKEASQSPIAAGWLDIFNIALMGLVIMCGKNVLWFVISLILLFYIGTEFIQMINSKMQYFKEKSNWIDMCIIGFLMVVMYVPNEKIVNPHKFSVFDDPSEHSSENETAKCRVKRAMSAALIVLTWTRLLMSMAKFPGWKEYNLYVIMFYQVMQRYFKILAWYSIYLIAFGLGFYIMLHDDTINPKNTEFGNFRKNETSKASGNNNHTKSTFDNPYLALAKTSAMFIGEIEFGDLPIHGGDINVTMAHAFLLLFIFLMIVVLMNLLNGLAVSDTGKIVADSEISSQITFINTIQYFESVYIGHVKWVRFLHKIFPRLETFVKNYLIPRGLLVFYSPYMKNDELGKSMKLTLPLPTQKLLFDFGSSSSTCCDRELGPATDNVNSTYVDYLTQISETLFGTDDNFGSKEFLENARNILRQEKLSKIKRRREELEQRRKKKKRVAKEKRMKHIENILQNSFSFSSYSKASCSFHRSEDKTTQTAEAYLTE